MTGTAGDFAVLEELDRKLVLALLAGIAVGWFLTSTYLKLRERADAARFRASNREAEKPDASGFDRGSSLAGEGTSGPGASAEARNGDAAITSLRMGAGFEREVL